MHKLSRVEVARFVDVPLEAVEPMRERVQLPDGRMTTAHFRIRGDSDAVLVTEVDAPPGAEREIHWILESQVLRLAA